MVEFGDELIIESFKIPWLIWIQLLVTILLIILVFFGFSAFSSDSSAAAPPSTAAPTNPAASNRFAKVESRRGRRDVGSSEGSIQQEPENEEGSSSTMIRIFHPCNYIGLAKRALFKCFGLDSTSESSSNRRHEKQE